jgi:hypothetical protein
VGMKVEQGGLKETRLRARDGNNINKTGMNGRGTASVV